MQKPHAAKLDRHATHQPSSTLDGARDPGAPLVGNRFAILGLIGVGGMASVYRARDVTLDETVALKVIARDIAREPGMLERFRREVRLARRVTHPNVARCFDIGQDHEDCFFTMELIEGESLRTRLGREGRLSPSVAIAIAIEVCEGLGAAHRAGVVHRDLKPDNVMLETEGRVVLTDFGIASARLPNDTGLTLGTLVGTPEYMAPEQVRGERDLDGRADIYSLGAMLFELVTGRAAWSGPTALATVVARLSVDPPDPRGFVAMDDDLAALILKCMARRREDRFATVNEVAEALLGISSASGAFAARDGEGHGASERPEAPSAVGARIHDKSVVVRARSDDDDELSIAVAEGLGDLIERHLRSATNVRVAARAPARGSPKARAVDGVAPTMVARDGSGASLIVDASIAIVGQSVAVDVSLVNIADGIVLSSRHHTGPRAQLFDMASGIARDVADKLLTGRRQHSLPAGMKEVESLDLWLRARFELASGSPTGLDRAVALFERAMERSKDDPWLLSSYAATLVDRFVDSAGSSADLTEAVGMADSVLATTALLGDGWLARGLARFELGDAPGAVADVAQAGRIMPDHARVHAFRGRLLAETKCDERAKAHLERALALHPRLFDAQLDLATCEALAGAIAAGRERVARLLDEREATPEVWLLASRFALWSGDVRNARVLRSRLETFVLPRREACVHVLAAARGEPTEEGAEYFAWLAEDDPRATRRAARARQIEAELSCATGNFGGAMDALDAAAHLGTFCDLAWLDGCPLLAPLRRTPRFAEVREHVVTNAGLVTAALDSTREDP